MLKELLKADQLIESIEQFKICTEGRPDWMMAFFSLAEAQIGAGLQMEAIESLVVTIDLARKQGHDDPIGGSIPSPFFFKRPKFGYLMFYFL